MEKNKKKRLFLNAIILILSNFVWAIYLGGLMQQKFFSPKAVANTTNIPNSKTLSILLKTPLVTDDKASFVEFAKSNPLLVFTIIFAIVSLILIIVIIIVLFKYRQTKIEARLEKSKADSNARQEFLSRMSHEIRTPMNAIIGLTDIISMNENIPQDILESLNKIHSSAHYLLGLINNILDMSKIDQGKMILSEEPFSLEQMIDSLTDMMDSEANRFGVQLRIEKEIQHNVIIGDEIRLRQVLTNLLSNAFKYTPSEGLVSFKILEKTATDEQVSFYFEVTDSGIGIPLNEQERIFQSFEQVESNISRSMGTGLGLPISQSIIRLMGGEISLNSERNKGSQFSFTLTFPIGKIKIQEAVSEENYLEGKNILIAEDNEINAEIITSFLEIKGAIIQLESNGKEALEEFRSSPNYFYDLILMDIQMPVMDGITSTKQIRMLEKDDAKQVPIIAMTANTFKEDVEKAINSGMNDFIPKPIDVNNLYKVLNQTLTLHSRKA